MQTEENELLEEIWVYRDQYKRAKGAYLTAKSRSAHKQEHISKMIALKNSKMSDLLFLNEEQNELDEDHRVTLKKNHNKEKSPIEFDSSMKFQEFTNMKIYGTVRERVEAMVKDKVEQTLKGKFEENYNRILEAEDQEGEENKLYIRPLLCNALGIAYEMETKLIQPGQTEESENLDIRVDKFYTTLRIGAQTTFDDVRIAIANFWNIKDYRRIEFYQPDRPDEIIMSKKQIDKYFKGKGQEQLNKKLFLMKLNNEKKEEALNIDLNEPEEKIKEENTDEFAHMIYKIPKLLPFLELNKGDVDDIKSYKKKWRDPKAFNENHFCIFFLLFIALLLTIFSISKQRNAVDAYYDVTFLDKTIDITSLNKVTNFDKLLKFMLTLSQFFVATSDLEASLSKRPVQIARPIELRMYRVQSVGNCEYVEKTCYYEFYNAETRDTSTQVVPSGIFEFPYYLDDSIEVHEHKKYNLSMLGALENIADRPL